MSKDLLLSEYQPRSQLVTEDNTPKRARFEVIDAHNHLGLWDVDLPHYQPMSPEHWMMNDVTWMLDKMDELNIKCIVNLDGGWGEQLQLNLDRYKNPHPDRFCVFTWVDWSEYDDPGFEDKWSKELERSVSAGAQGLKVFKDLGLVYRDRTGKLIMPNNPKLDPIWAMAGELGIPVLIHVADPVAFFLPLDETNERWEELHNQPSWHFYGKDYPSFMELMEIQQDLLERHPGTNFISPHVFSYSENLDYVGETLEKYPNLFVDISARIGELGRQPYKTRQFLIKYADRVLFGTDEPFRSDKHYKIYFRALETNDEYFEYGRNQGRFRIYGFYLPDDVLKKMYHENIRKLIPGLG